MGSNHFAIKRRNRVLNDLFEKMDNSFKKIVRKKTFWIFFCGIGFLFPIYRSLQRELPADLPIYFKVPSFQLIEENGNVFGSKDLEGKVYIANFIFTSCPTTCPRLSLEMEKIQKRVRGLGSKIALVSFTVDPENDSSRVLFKYARKHHANPYIWHFLTGKKKELETLLIDGFKVTMGDKIKRDGFKLADTAGPKEEISLWDIAHSEKFVLVDEEGRVRGYYSPEINSINQMMIDVGLLVNRPKNI